MQYQTAKQIAERIYDTLQPHCSVIHIAGSIRRLKPEGIKDVEIVCLPNKIQLGQYALFSTATATTNAEPTAAFRVAVAQLGNTVKGKPNGKYMKIELPENVSLDLFMPDDYDYYRQLAIRTGSADYARYVIAHGWNKIGWCGTEQGLRLMEECVRHTLPSGAPVWKCHHRNPTLPPVWEDEKAFFDWIKTPYLSPEKRIY